MKLVFCNDVIYGYATGAPWAIGGAERYQWLLARALAADGWQVRVGVREHLAPGSRTAVDGVEFVGLARVHALRAWSRFLRAERPDWWYWQGADHIWGPAVAVARMTGTRTVFSAAVDRDVEPRRALFRRPRLWPLYAWGLHASDAVVVQHRGQLEALHPRLRRKASLLPGIVALPEATVPHEQRARYVAWVALLRQVKRPDLLVEIARRMPDLRFVVCGGPTRYFSPPGYGEAMERALRAEPNVEYRGKVPPGEALRTTASAALLLSTSDEEGFPSTFLEAWAAGTPVVSLRLDPDGAIGREQIGAVPGSVEAAVPRIRSLVESPQVRETMGARARRHVELRHSSAAAAATLRQALAAETVPEESTPWITRASQTR